MNWLNPFLDILFFWLHVVVILFNLLGWIWPKMRKLHLIVVSATLFSWLILGLRYGFGYCFLTDWHWNIKRALGEEDLPASFITYFFNEYTPIHVTDSQADLITLVCFATAIVLTLYVNIAKKRLRR